MPIPGLKDTEDLGLSGGPQYLDGYITREELEAERKEEAECKALALGEPGTAFAGVESLPLSSHFGGPPSLRDKARADKTVTEATFGAPANYTQETAEWPGGKQ